MDGGRILIMVVQCIQTPRYRSAILQTGNQQLRDVTLKMPDCARKRSLRTDALLVVGVALTTKWYGVRLQILDITLLKVLQDANVQSQRLMHATQDQSVYMRNGMFVAVLTQIPVAGYKTQVVPYTPHLVSLSVHHQIGFQQLSCAVKQEVVCVREKSSSPVVRKTVAVD